MAANCHPPLLQRRADCGMRPPLHHQHSSTDGSHGTAIYLRHPLCSDMHYCAEHGHHHQHATGHSRPEHTVAQSCHRIDYMLLDPSDYHYMLDFSGYHHMHLGPSDYHYTLDSSGHHYMQLGTSDNHYMLDSSGHRYMHNRRWTTTTCSWTPQHVQPVAWDRHRTAKHMGCYTSTRCSIYAEYVVMQTSRRSATATCSSTPTSGSTPTCSPTLYNEERPRAWAHHCMGNMDNMPVGFIWADVPEVAHLHVGQLGSVGHGQLGTWAGQLACGASPTFTCQPSARAGLHRQPGGLEQEYTAGQLYTLTGL